MASFQMGISSVISLTRCASSVFIASPFEQSRQGRGMSLYLLMALCMSTALYSDVIPPSWLRPLLPLVY